MNQLASFCIISCLCLASVNAEMDANYNIPQLANKLGLTTLVKQVTDENLAPTLSGPGRFTVFGPTNAAFGNISVAVSIFISMNPSNLAKVLLYHVVVGTVPASALQDETLVQMANSDKARVNLYPKGKAVQVATLQCAPIDLTRVDQVATNGLIHVINFVMMPPHGTILDLLQIPHHDFTTLLAALNIAGLSDALSGSNPLTLFAPTDAAFAKIPEDKLNSLLADVDALKAVLLGHVVSETYCSAGLESGSLASLNGDNLHVTISASGVSVNGSRVIFPDASVTNGVAHIIDTVILG